MPLEVKLCYPSCKSQQPCKVDGCPHITAASYLPSPAFGTQLGSSAAPDSGPCACHCQQPIKDSNGDGAARWWGFKTSCFAGKKPPEQSEYHKENKTASLSVLDNDQHMRCYSCPCFTKSSSCSLKAAAWASPQKQRSPLFRSHTTPAKLETPTATPVEPAGDRRQARLPMTTPVEPAISGQQARLPTTTPIEPAIGRQARLPMTTPVEPAIDGQQARLPTTTPVGFFKIEVRSDGRRIIGEALLSIMALLSGLGFGLTLLFIIFFIITSVLQ